MKITPGHDFNDFEVGKRHDLPLINILNKDGTLNENVPQAYRGLDREEARKVVLADLEALELVDRTEPIVHAVPHDEKTKTVVLEPYLTEQWYLNVAPLAEKAIEAVEEGRTKFVPATGPASISTGCATSIPGASRASFGGAIKFPSGTTRTRTPMSRRPRRKRSPKRAQGAARTLC